MEAHKTDKQIRARFAPSPTGFLHIGSVRTALFNYLFTRKFGGTYILRIEDTDKERSKTEYMDDLLAGLHWLGLDWDEGPEIGGNYGPYLQSQRGGTYKKYIQQLLDEGKAYFCFCTKDELDAKRQIQIERGEVIRYDRKCADLSAEEIEKNIKEGKPCVIRFRNPGKKVSWNDLIFGKIEFDSALYGDEVIAKDIDTPLYNFAVVVDDHEMAITHVIRGEDHIPNTPKQILFREALGFEPWDFAHMPLILGPDKSKLSKRHNVEPVTVYRQKGYLKEALVNFIAFLGWNPGTDQEIFSLDQLVEEFSFERCRKSGAIFNSIKLDWFNGLYIRGKSDDELFELVLPYLESANLIKKGANGGYQIVASQENVEKQFVVSCVNLYKERLTTLSEIPTLIDFLFTDNVQYEPELLAWKDLTIEQAKENLKTLQNILENISENDWTKENLEKIILAFIEDPANNIKNRGYVLWPMRVAITGKKASCGPFEAAAVLGKVKTIERIKSSQ